MPPGDELPTPSSPELRNLPISSQAKAIYRLLYEGRGTPPTMLEIRERLAAELGDQEQLDRRRRELNKYFVIEKSGTGRETRYVLAARKAAAESDLLGISERLRAEVLQYARCAMCGRSPAEHRVVLQVDHKMPLAWGGTNDRDNLQPLCEECNRGKKDHFRTLNHLGPQIRQASEHDEPHKRIGELLKAVHPGEVRSDVLEMVANQRQHQEDWQKRLRELRELGWDYKSRRERDSRGRVRVFYRLTKWTAWPDGSIRSEISAHERRKKHQGPG